MRQYKELVLHTLNTGTRKTNRTGVDTISVFGYQMRFNLQRGFPLLTTKKVHFKSVVHELLWFLSGNTNTNYLKEHGVTIWDEWADGAGNLGPIYGAQWRSWLTEYTPYKIDQIKDVIENIKTDPDSRRHIVSAWNVTELEYMALPPCHLLFQFYVRNQHYLDLQLYQRSADVGLGVPFNIASYSLLLHMIADQTNLEPGEFIWTGGDVHIYENHRDQLWEQIQRKTHRLPQITLNPNVPNIDNYTASDIQLHGYNPEAPISLPIAV